MKKNRYTLLAAMAIAAGANAQITINNTGYINTGTDTLGVVTNLSAFAYLGAPISNGSWDMSTAVYDANLNFYYKNQLSPNPFPNNPFPTSDYSTPTVYTGGGLQYTTNTFIKMDATGILNIGENKYTRQPISIGAVSGNPNDSIVYPVQTITHTATARQLAFPATMGTNWSSSYNATTQFTLTVTAFGLNQAACERRSVFSYKDTVVGWGKMRVKDFRTSAASGWMDVLQVREYATITDSFYLNGTLAPATLLTAFGLSQGMVYRNYRTKFYRAGEQFPLAFAEHQDATFSGAPTNINNNQMRLPSPSAVQNIAGIGAVRLYPNPVSNGLLHISASAAQTGKLDYTLYSTTGQTLATGTAPLNGELALPAGISAGTYYLRLSSGSKGSGLYPVTVR